MTEPKTILITGVAGGIGRATMTLFAEKGWRVIGVDRNPFGEGFPANGLFIQSDISHADEIAAIFEKALASGTATVIGWFSELNRTSSTMETVLGGLALGAGLGHQGEQELFQLLDAGPGVGRDPGDGGLGVSGRRRVPGACD